MYSWQIVRDLLSMWITKEPRVAVSVLHCCQLSLFDEVEKRRNSLGLCEKHYSHQQVQEVGRDEVPCLAKRLCSVVVDNLVDFTTNENYLDYNCKDCKDIHETNYGP